MNALFLLSNTTENVAKMIIYAARQNMPKLANEHRIVLNDTLTNNIEQGLVNAFYHSKSEYTEDPQIRKILQENQAADEVRSLVTTSTNEVISSVLYYATTNQIEIRPEDVERVISELFSI